jgi:hypothetical protein
MFRFAYSLAEPPSGGRYQIEKTLRPANTALNRCLTLRRGIAFDYRSDYVFDYVEIPVADLQAKRWIGADVAGNSLGRAADGATYDRPQPLVGKRVFEKVEGAGAHQFDGNRELRIAPDHHDRKRKVAVPDLVHQHAQANAGKIERCQHTPGGGCGNLIEELLRAIPAFDNNGLVRKGVGYATALTRKRIDDENCFGHEPSDAPLTAIGDAVIAAPDLTDVKGHEVRMICAVATNNMR